MRNELYLFRLSESKYNIILNILNSCFIRTKRTSYILFAKTKSILIGKSSHIKIQIRGRTELTGRTDNHHNNNNNNNNNNLDLSRFSTRTEYSARSRKTIVFHRISPKA